MHDSVRATAPSLQGPAVVLAAGPSNDYRAEADQP